MLDHIFLLIPWLSLSTALIAFYLVSTRRGKPSLPPGPPPKFLVGNALEIRKARFLWLKLAEYGKVYGGIMNIWLLSRPVVVLSDPRIVGELFDKRAGNFSNRPTIQMAELAGWGDSILFTQYNQKLRTYRKLLHQTFNARATLDFQDLQKNEVHKLMKRLADKPSAFMNHAHLMAGSVAIRIAYGYKVKDSSDEFIRSAEEFMAAVGEATIPGRWMVEVIPWLRFIPSWVPGAGFKRRTEEWARKTAQHRQKPFDGVLKNMIEGTAAPSFTSKLLEPEDPTHIVGAEEKDMIKCIASSLYGAGADTTSSLLQFFFLAMTLYPGAQAKAQAEIDNYLKSSYDTTSYMLTVADCDRLPYTKAIVSETLRWHPVINLAVHNTGLKDEDIAGYRIPGNTMVIANIWSILHNPATYANPEQFYPERYLGDAPDPDPTMYAFGFGRRICPGIHIAHQSLWLSISNILANFDIGKAQKADGTEIVPIESFTNDVLSHPEPFECAIRVRSSASQTLIDSVEL